MATTKSGKRTGRPPTGINDLIPFTARFTPKSKERLTALAQVLGIPAYTVLEQAWWVYWASLPKDQRDAAEKIAATLEAAGR